jgi:Na+/proline symporter
VLKGFLIVAILSAAMSSVSSALTSLASVSTMDFVKHVLPQRSEAFFLRFSKVSTVVWAAALILLASLSREVPFVLNAAFSLRGLTSGALLGGLALAVFWRKGRARPVIIGMWTALATMTVIQVLPRFEWGRDPCRAVFARFYLAGAADGLQWAKDLWMKTFGTEIFWPWYTLIGAVITLSTAWAVRKGLGLEMATPQEEPRARAQAGRSPTSNK